MKLPIFMVGFCLIGIDGKVNDMLYRKILAPLDGSMTAALALNHISQFLAADGTVHLLSVLERHLASQLFLTENGNRSTRFEERKRYLKSEVLRMSYRNIQATSTVAIGDPVDVIIEKSQNSDLILFTAHGWGHFNRSRYGSVVDEVLNHTHCPVIVVPLNRFESLARFEPKSAPAGAASVG